MVLPFLRVYILFFFSSFNIYVWQDSHLFQCDAEQVVKLLSLHSDTNHANRHDAQTYNLAQVFF